MNSDNYGMDIVRAVQTDACHRELHRLYAPTPQEQRDEEKRQRAIAFETGDHQPDGTVMSTDMKGYQLLQVKVDPAMALRQAQQLLGSDKVACGQDYAGQVNRACADSGFGQGVLGACGANEIARMEAQLRQHDHDMLHGEVACGHNYANAYHPAPHIAAAIREMESRLQQLNQMHPESTEVVVMQLALVMTPAERARVEANPDGLVKVQRQMEREFAYEIRHQFGLDCKLEA